MKPQYVVALTLLLVFALVLVAGSARYARVPAGSFSLHFFVLGAAFLLLETRSLVTFSLLFGGLQRDSAASGSTPFFLGVVDSMGVRQVLRFAGIAYRGARPVPGAPGVRAPEGFDLVAASRVDGVDQGPGEGVFLTEHECYPLFAHQFLRRRIV